jgi:RNA polymerase sigma factor (sigma-70 family)
MSEDLSGLGDDELVVLAKEGSTPAFAAIYDRHAGRVARALASFAGPDHALLDDLVQDVFLRVVKGLPSYVPGPSFVHWLSTIALNVGRNHARRHAKVTPVDPVELEHTAVEGSLMDDTIAAASLMRLLGRLPVAMREVVSLRVAWELPYGEIAELLGIPEGTARSRMHNAMVILRDQVGTDVRRRSNHHE